MEFQEARALTFGTWNVRGLSKKKIDVISEIERENEDIVVLTETKIRGVGREDLGNYVHLKSAVTYKGGLPSAGVSVLIKKEFTRNLEWEGVSERIIWVKLSIGNCKVVVIGVYWVDECRSPDKKNLFQSKLKDVISNVEDNCELIVLGDFNAWVGKESNNRTVGEFGVDKQPNDNGIRLTKLCSEFNLKIQNTFFKHRDIHKYTWYGSGVKKSLVDYCITKQDSKLKVLDVVACRWLECGTDHVFLEATILFPGNQQRLLDSNTPEMPKYKTYLLFSKILRASYKEHLESSIDLSVNRTTDAMYKHLKESIHTAAEHVLGFVDEDRFGEFLWDSEIRELRRSRVSQATRDTSEIATPDDSIDAEIKNSVWEGICADVNSRGKNKKYRAVKNILEELLNTKWNQEVTIDIASLENFFKKRFTETRVNFETSDSTRNSDETDEVPLRPVSVTDVEMALDDLEYCNYPAPGGFSVKLLKYSSTKTKILLRDLIQCIFNGENIPDEINEMYIYVTSNVKNRSKWVSESTVQVMHPVMNIMCSLLKRTLENTPSFKEVISYEPQLDTTFVLRLILQKNATKQEELVHFVVLDLANGYASVSLSKLYEILHAADIGGNLIGLIKRLTEGTSVRVTKGNECSEVFHLNKGLKTPCSLGPLLYKMYISESLKAWGEEIGFQGLRIGLHNLSFLYSEDKLAIFSNTKKNLESMLGKLKGHFRGIGLRITPKIVSYIGDGDLRLGDETIPGESAIDYQGSILEHNGTNEQDVTRRMLEIKNMIGLLHPSARDEMITERNKRRIFNSIVKSVLTHGCETWTVTEPLRRQIDAVELRYWKWCCEKFPEKLTSTKIYELMKVNQKVSKVIMLKKAAWYTKVKEMSDEQWARLVLEWEPEGKRKRRRPSAKWVDGVEDFITTMGQYSRHFLKNGRFGKQVIKNVLNDSKEDS